MNTEISSSSQYGNETETETESLQDTSLNISTEEEEEEESQVENTSIFNEQVQSNLPQPFQDEHLTQTVEYGEQAFYTKKIFDFILLKCSEKERASIKKSIFSANPPADSENSSEFLLKSIALYSTNLRLASYLKEFSDDRSKALLIYLSLLKQNPAFLSQRKNSTLANILLEEKLFSDELVKRINLQSFTSFSNFLNQI